MGCQMFRLCMQTILLLTALVLSWPAHSRIDRFGPFSVDTERPDVIELNGSIDDGSALNFRRALSAAENPKILVLDSGGGLVDMGLLIADDVHHRGLSTIIPKGAKCYSACSYIFLGGQERLVEGDLGVHQISSGLPDLERAQMSISDILDVLNRFETPIEVLTIMFRTPADEMHVFTPEEVARYGINRSSAVTQAAPETEPSDGVEDRIETSPEVAIESLPPDMDALTSIAEAAPDPTPALSGETSAAISALESYAKLPTRIAIYAGLDFFGADISSASVSDAPACAARCFQMGGQCRAFTFNMLTSPSRGPNCFLKAGRGEVDGNSAAFSGELLARADPAPRSMTLSIIDPQADLYRDVDVPGMDLSSRPSGASTEFSCRRECVGDDRCRAFTFLRNSRQCWLKSGVGNVRSMTDAVSGAKRAQTFTPEMISLD